MSRFQCAIRFGRKTNVSSGEKMFGVVTVFFWDCSGMDKTMGFEYLFNTQLNDLLHTNKPYLSRSYREYICAISIAQRVRCTVIFESKILRISWIIPESERADIKKWFITKIRIYHQRMSSSCY